MKYRSILGYQSFARHKRRLLTLVLATSHGYRSNGVCAIRIGTDVFSEKSGDFSQLETGLKNKIVFSTACKLTGINSGISLIERMARETGATIIGSDYSIPGLLGFHGNDLNMSPIRNFIVGLFGGNFENSFKMTNGYTTQTIYNLTIDKNMGIRWNAGNKNIFSR